MNIKRDPSRALQIGFLILLSVSAVQVGWWIIERVGHAHDIRDRFGAHFAADAEAIGAVFEGASIDEIRELMPQLDLQADGRANVSDAARQALADESARRINIYAWEGAFFLAVLLAGMTVLIRAIRHDAELRRRQQNFLAAVSHEFKSPLASMRLAAETLVLRAQEDESKRLGNRILEDGDRLLRMVDNLLDTTKLEEGRQELSPETVALKSIAENAAAGIAERAQRHGIAVRTRVDDKLKVFVDRDAVDTMVRNLLDNALKACIAGEGHSIEVDARRSDGGIELTVSDDGLGFPPEDARMMFEKFYRLGDELQRSTPGTGLGLYLVKRLVEMSGARIAAASDGPGRGASVSIRWPKEKVE